MEVDRTYADVGIINATQVPFGSFIRCIPPSHGTLNSINVCEIQCSPTQPRCICLLLSRFNNLHQGTETVQTGTKGSQYFMLSPISVALVSTEDLWRFYSR